MPCVEFKKISYDRILGDMTAEYLESHPDVPFHEVIDIIRPHADQDYLDQIARHFNEEDAGKEHKAWGESQGKSIIYLDRNNTPDIWGDIKRTVEKAGQQTRVDYRTVVLLPKQEPFDKTLYRVKNPICPHLIFECCKRIFNRKEHGCLSGNNKPKAVEVLLKFAKLHDDFDFHDEAQVRSYFDEILFLDFMKYSSRAQPLLPETITGVIDAYNATPENFGVPADHVINKMIGLMEKQIEIDKQIEDGAQSCQQPGRPGYNSEE